MARKPKNINAEITKEAEEKVEQKDNQVKKEKPYKSWDERTNEEKRASVNEYSKAIIAKAIKEKNAFWAKDMSKEEIQNTMPYNASKGIVYTGQTSALLRAVSDLNNYKEPSFLTMKQANFLGGTLKRELDENGNPALTKNGKEAYVQGVKIAILKTEGYVPKRDKDGNQIFRPVLDENGKQKRDKLGYLSEAVMEKVYYKEPKLETITLYHTSQFDNLKPEKLKERDIESLEKLREKISNSKYDPRPNVNAFGLTEKTTRDINNFLNSELKGLDYQKIQEKEISNEKEISKNKTQKKGLER
ncbi:ArdC family protein [Campylobacter sp. CNRCH_2007_0968H]|uniref:ArdC family protein n=1 Tax=Campylobacter sp. CNRCH_2007_0968H TaxID=2911598 RepID=UPI0021E69319|nr:ArdC family protein [Campylobacter sp. CNRCH_2007_0968H]MCV3531301.1 ArdC family protein [Campylobacter sp. CNRCH_2007_0968H]